jgi:hypothetical protein
MAERTQHRAEVEQQQMARRQMGAAQRGGQVPFTPDEELESAMFVGSGSAYDRWLKATFG